MAQVREGDPVGNAAETIADQRSRFVPGLDIFKGLLNDLDGAER
jgi:hypothetical protein